MKKKKLIKEGMRSYLKSSLVVLVSFYFDVAVGVKTKGLR